MDDDTTTRNNLESVESYRGPYLIQRPLSRKSSVHWNTNNNNNNEDVQQLAVHSMSRTIEVQKAVIHALQSQLGQSSLHVVDITYKRPCLDGGRKCILGTFLFVIWTILSFIFLILTVGDNPIANSYRSSFINDRLRLKLDHIYTNTSADLFAHQPNSLEFAIARLKDPHYLLWTPYAEEFKQRPDDDEPYKLYDTPLPLVTTMPIASSWLLPIELANSGVSILEGIERDIMEALSTGDNADINCTSAAEDDCSLKYIKDIQFESKEDIQNNIILNITTKDESFIQFDISESYKRIFEERQSPSWRRMLLAFKDSLETSTPPDYTFQRDDLLNELESLMRLIRKGNTSHY